MVAQILEGQRVREIVEAEEAEMDQRTDEDWLGPSVLEKLQQAPEEQEAAPVDTPDSEAGVTPESSDASVEE